MDGGNQLLASHVLPWGNYYYANLKRKYYDLFFTSRFVSNLFSSSNVVKDKGKIPHVCFDLDSKERNRERMLFFASLLTGATFSQNRHRHTLARKQKNMTSR